MDINPPRGIWQPARSSTQLGFALGLSFSDFLVSFHDPRYAIPHVRHCRVASGIMASPLTPNISGGSLHKKLPRFTVFVRLPFPRRDFVDPPPVSRERSDHIKREASEVS